MEVGSELGKEAIDLVGRLLWSFLQQKMRRGHVFHLQGRIGGNHLLYAMPVYERLVERSQTKHGQRDAAEIGEHIQRHEFAHPLRQHVGLHHVEGMAHGADFVAWRTQAGEQQPDGEARHRQSAE